MTKTQKRIFGCFGLGLVTAMTVVAASVPLPIASATTMTDTIRVRVVDGTPTIDVSASVGNDEVTTDPQVTIDMTFDSVDTINITLDYTDLDGVVHHYDGIYNYSPDGLPGDASIPVTSDKGYGHYVYTITATGYGDGAPEERVVEFTYAPYTATAEQNKDNDGKTIDVTIGTPAPEINKVQVVINGVVVDTIDANNLPGTFHYSPELVGGNVNEDGTYNVQVIGIHIETDAEGNPILDGEGNPIETVIYRTSSADRGLIVDFTAVPVSPAGIPDTGGLFNNLNVSREDYLITGVIVFLVIGIVAFGIVARNRKSNSKSHKR